MKNWEPLMWALLPELACSRTFDGLSQEVKMSDASTELSMTFSIDVALALSHRVWHCYSDFGMTISQQSVFGHCHLGVAV